MKTLSRWSVPGRCWRLSNGGAAFEDARANTPGQVDRRSDGRLDSAAFSGARPASRKVAETL